MKIGMMTDSLGALSFDDLVGTPPNSAFTNWSLPPATGRRRPHLALDGMLDSASARDEFIAKHRGHGLSISALNCSGNPLHPGEPEGSIGNSRARQSRLLASWVSSGWS